MAVYNPPELRRLAAFMEALPNCPHGCPNGFVYPSATFRVPTLDDTIDDQVTEIIGRYEREADGMLRQHLTEDHQSPHSLDDFLAFLDDVSREARRREAAYTAWLDQRMPEIAAELTAELIPAELRAAGMRFAWTPER